MDALASALEQPGHYIEFQGQHGRGKSTRLHAIAEQLPDAALAELIASFGDDLRTIEDILYSLFQALDDVGCIGAERIESIEAPSFTTDRG